MSVIYHLHRRLWLDELKALAAHACWSAAVTIAPDEPTPEPVVLVAVEAIVPRVAPALIHKKLGLPQCRGCGILARPGGAVEQLEDDGLCGYCARRVAKSAEAVG